MYTVEMYSQGAVDRLVKRAIAEERVRSDQLRDALSGCIDWIKENCEGPAYPYCVVEAEAALKNLKVIK